MVEKKQDYTKEQVLAQRAWAHAAIERRVDLAALLMLAGNVERVRSERSRLLAKPSKKEVILALAVAPMDGATDEDIAKAVCLTTTTVKQVRGAIRDAGKRRALIRRLSKLVEWLGREGIAPKSKARTAINKAGKSGRHRVSR